MDKDNQLLVRIKSFLNSVELLDSPTARELYEAYREMNNAAAQRLVECGVLLQKKQKIEAVSLAQQEPALLENIDTILFSERQDLLILADLYDWAAPDEIRPEAVAELKKAFAEMDDLRPLLTEFRRIARTDQVKNKFHLLREIVRIDKDNPEWRLPLSEVENQYVSQLIAEAQNAIQMQDYARLEQINQEFHSTAWVVTIPTIVLQKVEKVVMDHHHKVAKDEAAVLLEKLNASYASYEVAGVEDALLCWQAHCEKYQYAPDENEERQLKEVKGWLQDEKKKQQEQQEQQLRLEQVLALINEAAPLSQVDSLYAEAQATELEIPEYVVQCVAKYREDVERAWRTASILHGLKIAGTVAVTLLILAGGAVWLFQFLLEREQIGNLDRLINANDLVGAKTTLADIEKNYPRLAKGAKITSARAKLHTLEHNEKNRSEEFQRQVHVFERKLALRPPEMEFLKNRIQELRKKARGKEEKARVEDLERSMNTVLRKYSDEIDTLFMKKAAVMKKYRDEVNRLVSKGEYEDAAKALSRMEKIRQEIDELPAEFIDKSSLEMNRDVLNSLDRLRQLLAEHQNSMRDQAAAVRTVMATDSFPALEEALSSLVRLLEQSENRKAAAVAKSCAREAAYFKAIMSYQSGRLTAVPDEYRNTAFFRDVLHIKEFDEKFSGAAANLKRSFDNLQKTVNKQNVVLIRIRIGKRVSDLYVYERSISVMDREDGRDVEISCKRYPDNVKISFKRSLHSSVIVRIGDDVHYNCQMVSPEIFSEESMHTVRAPHQVVIEQIFREVNSLDEKTLLRSGFSYLKKILKSRQCAPYWKMQLSLRILNALAMIDRSQNQQFRKYRDELNKLSAMDHASGNPLDNEFLAEKIRIFCKNVKMADLELCLEQNDFLQKLSERRKGWRFQCIGAAMKLDHNLKYVVFPKYQDQKMEVFCFTPGMAELILVGYYGGNGLIINDGCQDKVNGRLLFTVEPFNAMTQTYQDLKNNKVKIDLKQMTWPNFWPQNMK